MHGLVLKKHEYSPTQDKSLYIKKTLQSPSNKY